MERSDDQGNERAQMEEAETTKLKQMERNVTGEATQTKAIIENGNRSSQTGEYFQLQIVVTLQEYFRPCVLKSVLIQKKINKNKKNALDF